MFLEGSCLLLVASPISLPYSVSYSSSAPKVFGHLIQEVFHRTSYLLYWTAAVVYSLVVQFRLLAIFHLYGISRVFKPSNEFGHYSATIPFINMLEEKHWNPVRFLAQDSDNADDTSVIILNTPIENQGIFTTICRSAKMVVAADGGANRIYDLQVQDEDAKATQPGAIVGDFDSIREDVKKYYEIERVPFHHDPDQYATDFTKSLKYIKKNSSSDNSSSIIVFGGLGGRPDQAFAQLHQVYMAARNPALASGDIYLFTAEGILFLLEKGVNRINTSYCPDLITEKVGIIPLGKPAKITTQGLEWDVTDWETSFETQVSTSNHIRAKEVVVTTSERVFFTFEMVGKIR